MAWLPVQARLQGVDSLPGSFWCHIGQLQVSPQPQPKEVVRGNRHLLRGLHSTDTTEFRARILRILRCVQVVAAVPGHTLARQVILKINI